MKKELALAIILLVVLSLTACGSSSKESSKTPDSEISADSGTSAESDDAVGYDSAEAAAPSSDLSDTAESSISSTSSDLSNYSESVATAKSENPTDSEYAPYFSVIETLENEYGSATVNPSDDSFGSSLLECDGLCWLELLDMDHMGEKELLAVCKMQGEDDYKGYLYTIRNGEADQIFLIDVVTSYTNGGFYYIDIHHSEMEDVLVSAPEGTEYRICYGFFEGEFKKIDYQIEISYSSTEDSRFYIDSQEVSESAFNKSMEEHGMGDGNYPDYENLIYIKGYGEEKINIDTIRKIIEDTKAEIGFPDSDS